jgi:hypothetical protein
MANLDALSASAAAAMWVSSGALIGTTLSSDADRRALLTLDLALDLLPEALGLKDATPYNVLFRGPHPVFVDIL